MENEEQIIRENKFIDEYLQTYSIEASAISAGFPKKDAMTIGIDLLASPEIQKRLKERENVFNQIAQSNKMTKERLLNTMMFQYNKANQKYLYHPVITETKEAVDILERIAKWCGVDPDNVKTDPVVINITNLDESKI